MRRAAVFSVVSAVLMAAPAGAPAQGVPSDPEADSPSGVVYEIPVEQARKDAAPKRERHAGGENGAGGSSGGSGGGSGSSGTGAGSGSGTSGSGADDAAAPGGASTAAGGTKDTSIRSDNNFGTSSNVPGTANAGSSGDGGAASAAERIAQTSAASTGGPSDGVVYPLLALLVAVGAGIGVFAGWRARRGQPG